MAVLPSAESAIDWPMPGVPSGSPGVNLLPCCVHTPPLRVNTHAAPIPPSSLFAPTMAVLPSADNATEDPCAASPAAPVPTNLFPCCDHTPPLRVNTQAAP